MGEDSRSLDAQLSKIQKSTRTLVPAVLPLHDILRQKYSWYYKWSLFPASKIIHWLILLLYIAGAGFITFNLFNQPKTILAASSTKAAGLGENVAGAWDDWSTPTNIYTNNNAYAVVSDVSSILSDQLKATNFGFAIPAGATINGVQVNIYRFADSNDPDLDSTQDSTVQLVKAGSATGNNKADLATYWPTVETLKSYGGAADLWGVALTAADVNASNFGVILVIQSATDANTPQTSNVDYIEIAVTYTEATTPTYDQKHYKFYQDDAGLNLATQLAAEDTTYSNASVSTNYRVRIETANTGTGAGNISRRLEFKEDAGAWTQITTNSNNVRLSLSSQFADAAATTQRLTGVGTFTAGQGKESGSDTSSISLTNAYNTEDEYSFAFQTGAASKTYQFRISNAGVALTTYTQTPQMAVASAPTVTTSAATGVTATTATGNGEITSTGGLNSTARGFKVSSAGAGTCDDTTTFSEAGSYGLGTFTTPAITGLTASTAYRYRAFATNPNGTSYGSCQQFTTLAAGPTVTTQAVSSVALTSVTGNGNITDIGGANATIRGFKYSAGASCTDITTVSEAGSFGVGAYTLSIPSLTANTQYSYRAFATNPSGTGYGSCSTFYTLADQVTGASASGDWISTSGYHEDIAWTLNGATTVRVARVSPAADVYTGSGTSTIDSALSANTLYTYRIYSRNGDALENSNYVEVSDTTPLAAPTGLAHTANTASSITLDWDDTAGATSYKVYSATHSDGETTQTTGCADTASSTCIATGLSINTQYTFHVHAVNANGTGAGSSDIIPYTSAETPLAPTYPTKTANTINVTIGANGNPAATEFAISCDLAQTLYLNYTSNACEAIVNDADHWRTRTNWGGDGGFADTGLSAGTTYYYSVKARNGDSEELALGPQSSETTLFSVDISGSTDVTSGTVKVAVNGTFAGTGSISGAGPYTWSISGVAMASGQSVIVWIDGASVANESTAITKYDGSGNITDMVLNKHVLTIGSADNQSLTLADVDDYTHTNNTSVMHTVAANVFNTDGDAQYSDDTLSILSGSTLTIGGTETLTTVNVNLAGTLTSGGNSTYNIGANLTPGSWTSSGTFNGSSATMTVTGTFTTTAGTFNAPSGTLTVQDTFTVANSTFVAGSGTVKFLPRPGSVANYSFNVTTNNNDFNNLEFNRADSGSEVNTDHRNISIVDDLLTVNGYLNAQSNTTKTCNDGAEICTFGVGGSAGLLLTVYGDINLPATAGSTGSVTVSWVRVGAVGGLDFYGNFIENDAEASFGVEVVTFKSTTANQTITQGAGSTSGVWHVNKADPNNLVTLQTNFTLTGGGWSAIVIDDGILYTNGFALTLGNEFHNLDTLRVNGNEVLTLGTHQTDTSSGTVDYAGTGTYGSLNYGNTYFNLLISGAYTSLTAAAATDVNGTFTQTAGTFVAPATTLNVAGDFAHTTGTFTHNNGTVILDGAGGSTQIVTGATTFKNLSMTAATARTINFASGVTQTVTGVWTATGVAGQLLTLGRNGGAGLDQWSINPTTWTVDYVAPANSNNLAASAINPTNYTDGGNDTNWFLLPPNAPTGVTIDTATASGFTAHWTDNSSNETGFKVYVSTTANADCSLATYPGAPDYTSAADAILQAVVGKSVNTQYCAKVTATNAYGDSSAAYSAAPLYTLANAPAAPTVTVNSWDAANGNSITVTVNANSNPSATEFAISCDNTPTNWLQGDGTCAAGLIWKTKTNWETGTVNYLKNLPADTEYTILSRARNGDNVSTANSTSTGPNRSAPAQPTGLGHTANTTTTITWDWADNAVAPDGYQLLNGTEALVETAVGASTVVQDQSDAIGTPLTVNTQYTVKTRGYRGAITGQPTATSSAYTSIEAPTNIDFDTVSETSLAMSSNTTLSNLSSGSSHVDFTYINSPTGGTGGTSSGSLTSDSYTDNILQPNNQYCYQTQAFNGDNEQSSAAVPVGNACKYTLANATGTPVLTALSWDVANGNAVSVGIAANSNPAATEFAIACNTGATSWLNASDGTCGAIADDANHWKTESAWETGTVNYLKNLAADTNITLITRARNGEETNTANSGDSNTVMTAPAQPAALGHTANTTTTITWDWNDNAVAPDGYQLLNGTDALVETAVGASTVVQDQSDAIGTPLTVNTQYTVKTRGYRGAITGQPTATSSAYTSIEDISGVNWGTFTTTTLSAQPANTPSNLIAGTSGIQYCNTTTAACSAWQQTTDAWTSTPLAVNTQYTFTIQSRNGDGETTTAATDQKYTRANAPITASHSGNTTGSISWTWGKNSNPAWTEFYASDTSGNNSDWVADAATWSAGAGKTANTQYTVTIKARNGNGIETDVADNPSTSAYTSIESPATLTSGTITANSIQVNISESFTNLAVGTSGIQFDETTANPGAGGEAGFTTWIQLATVTDTGLSAGTTYTYRAYARNADGDPTDYSLGFSFATSSGIENLLFAMPGQTFLSGTGISGSTSNQEAGEPFSANVYATDENSVLLNTNTDTVTLALNSSTASTSIPSPSSMVGGNTTFSNIIIYTAGTYVLNGTGSSGSSSPFIVSPTTCSASVSTATASPTSLEINNTSTVTISLKDAYSNVLSGHTVAVSSDQAGDIITYSAATTNSSGQILAYVTSASPHTSNLTVIDTTDTITLDDHPQITFTIPTIANPTDFAVSAGNAQVALSWTNPTTVTFDHINIYRSTISGVLGDLISSTSATSHLDSGLTNGVTYFYTLKAVDSFSNLSSGTVQLSATPTEPNPDDDQPPTAPTNLRATNVTTDSLRLIWDASTDDNGVAGYRIYNADTLINIGTTTNTFFNLAGLSVNTTYRFYVVAYDGAANVSAPSNILSIKTLATGRPGDEPQETITYLVMGGVPKEIDAGDRLPNNVTVTAADAGGNIVANYNKAVHFTSTDKSAKLPNPASDPYTFTAADAGVHQFSGKDFVLYTAGRQTITASDYSVQATQEVLVKSSSSIPEVFQKASNRVQEIIKPKNMSRINTGFLLTTAALLLIPLLINTALSFGAILPQLLYWFLQLLQLLGLKKKRKPWGVVFNSQTGQPIPYVMVRILEKKYNRVVERSVTDNQGRYGFLVKPGEYYITCSKRGYKFPSAQKTSTFYEKIYFGGEIKIADEKQSVAFNIPLDPLIKASLGWSIWIKIIRLNRILQKLRLSILVAGIILSIVMMIVAYELIYLLSLIFYILIGILEIYRSHKAKPYGVVTDNYNHPIDLAVIRVYQKKTNRLTETDVTDRDGRFRFLVAPGVYYITAVKPGYVDFKSHIMYLEKEKTMVSTNIKLKKIEK